MASYRVGVTIFRDHIGDDGVDALARSLEEQAGGGTAFEQEDRDIVRLTFMIEAEDETAAHARAEVIVDEAAASLEWDAQPRTVGAVRLAVS
jgi:hypothetical protein